MSHRVIYLNGRFVPEAEARVSIYDSGLLMGDMAYEVTRTIRQRPYRLRQHIDRLLHTLAVLHIHAGLAANEWERITVETLARNLPEAPPETDWNIIHNVSRGPGRDYADAFPPDQQRPTVVVSCFPMTRKLAELAPRFERGLDLVVPAQRSYPSQLLDTHVKTRSRVHFQLANLQAEELMPGATAVLVDWDGYLTETTSGNVFCVEGDTLLTPTTRNILQGVTRDVVLQLAARLGIAAEQCDITPDRAHDCREMFVTSTSIGILHARSFERQPKGDGSPGPVTSRLRRALYEELGLDLAEQARHCAEAMAPRER